MRNTWKLFAVLAVAGGLTACDKDSKVPENPSAKCYFAKAVDLTPIGDEYVCLYNGSYEPSFVAYDGTKVLPADNERRYIKIEFIGGSDTYFAYAGMSAEKYGREGSRYGFGAKETVPGQKGSVKVKYDDGNLKFEKNLTLIADPTGGAVAVDLGLSVKWATCNVGASKPEGYGDYFAWGATEPLYQHGYAQNGSPLWKAGKSGGYTWNNTPYQTANATSSVDTKWTKYLGSTTTSHKDASATNADALKTVLDPADDAAHVIWGGSWRMPTVAEINELKNNENCTWTWTTQNGVKGYKVVSKKPGYEGNWIFLPVAGYRSGTDLKSVDSNGDYWSSSLNTNASSDAYYLSFYSSNVSQSSELRFVGQSVRPVCPKN